jgi:magnesium transporter
VGVSCALYHEGKLVDEDLTPAEAARRAAAGEGFIWVGMHDPTPARLTEVAHAFDLPRMAVEDAARPGQRPKAESFGDVLVVTVQTVHYVDTHEVVETGQIVVFVARLGVVSVRSGPGRTVAAARERLEADPERLARGPMAIVYAILDQVVDDYEPVLDGVRHDIEAVEERVFAAGRDNPALRIYQLEREMIYFGRAVIPLLEPVERLARGAEGEGDEAELARDFREVSDHLQRVAGQLDSIRAQLTSILQTNLALVAARQNEDVRRISAFAAIIAVPTLVGSVYGMNFEHMPELRWRYGYALALFLMTVSCVLLYRGFRRAGWL